MGVWALLLVRSRVLYGARAGFAMSVGAEIRSPHHPVRVRVDLLNRRAARRLTVPARTAVVPRRLPRFHVASRRAFDMAPGQGLGTYRRQLSPAAASPRLRGPQRQGTAATVRE